MINPNMAPAALTPLPSLSSPPPLASISTSTLSSTATSSSSTMSAASAIARALPTPGGATNSPSLATKFGDLFFIYF